jgi:hypothetical protein
VKWLKRVLLLVSAGYLLVKQPKWRRQHREYQLSGGQKFKKRQRRFNPSS